MDGALGRFDVMEALSMRAYKCLTHIFVGMRPEDEWKEAAKELSVEDLMKQPGTGRITAYEIKAWAHRE